MRAGHSTPTVQQDEDRWCSGSRHTASGAGGGTHRMRTTDHPA
ncbi:MAG TPA: hypothetical protein VFL65_04000 [Jatrophihabitans sp.]|nr:hypothetical protein [Jatrophihabitans sp.]